MQVPSAPPQKTMKNRYPDFTRARECAESLLKENDVQGWPLLCLAKICKNKGLSVFDAEFNNYKDSAAGVLDDKRRIIYVNENERFTEKRFAIAYLLGIWILYRHLLKHNNDINTLIVKNKDVFANSLHWWEEEAICFATYLLAPLKFLNDYKFSSLKKDDLAMIFMIPKRLIYWHFRAL